MSEKINFNKIITEFGFELQKATQSGMIVWAKEKEICGEKSSLVITVLDNVVDIFIDKGDYNMIICNRYKVEKKEQLRFLIEGSMRTKVYLK